MLSIGLQPFLVIRCCCSLRSLLSLAETLCWLTLYSMTTTLPWPTEGLAWLGPKGQAQLEEPPGCLHLHREHIPCSSRVLGGQPVLLQAGWEFMELFSWSVLPLSQGEACIWILPVPLAWSGWGQVSSVGSKHF